MGTGAELSPPRRLDPVVVERLSALGIDAAITTAPAPSGAPSDLATAVAVAADGDAILVVVDVGDDRARWRRDAVELLGPLDRVDADRPFAALLLPADSPPRPGPVAILSPAGGASAYE